MADQATGLFSNYLRQVRIKTALPHILTPVLDVGCGNGPLSSYFSPNDYIGTDIDNEALQQAQTHHPKHTFYPINNIPPHQRYKTIVLLALIEHLPDPANYLKNLKNMLLPDGHIILTTPHPSFETIYNYGSRIGLFSKSAQEEHQRLLNKNTMTALTASIGMHIVSYRRFLAGANQLFILKKVL